MRNILTSPAFRVLFGIVIILLITKTDLYLSPNVVAFIVVISQLMMLSGFIQAIVSTYKTRKT